MQVKRIFTRSQKLFCFTIDKLIQFIIKVHIFISQVIYIIVFAVYPLVLSLISSNLQEKRI